MRKLIAIILTLAMMMSALSLTGLAEETPSVGAQEGRLIISEAGDYTLTGSLKGTVYVDPCEGDVTLILDNIAIEGGAEGGIVAVSGDSLTLFTRGQSQNVVNGGENPAYHAAIYSEIPTAIVGEGSLALQGQEYGIRMNNASLTYDYALVSFQTAQPILSNATVATENTTAYLDRTDVLGAETKTDVAFAGKVSDVGTAASAFFEAPMMSASINTSSSNPVNGSTPPEKPADNTNNADNPPAMPGANNQTQNGNPSAMPDSSNQTQSGSMGNPPAIPDSDQTQSGNAAPQMPGNMAGNMGGMPGSNQNVTYAESPSEIVTSTVENTAASLEADMDNATTYVMSDENNQVKITESGTYVVTGSSSDGNITVKKGTTGVVLVLENLDLTSTTGATLSVNKQAEVKIIVSGTVTLTDNENPEDENSTDEAVADAYDGAALKVKADGQIYITGDGTLNINGNAKNGLKGGDNSSIVVDGGVTINIQAANDGINGNYDVTLLSGELNIDAEDDAVHADHILTVGRAEGTGPAIHVTSSYEGLEGTVVNIFGGEIDINASDDGINAANSDNTYAEELDFSINMTGGKVSVKAGGDGLDSNGNINLIGGELSIQSASMGGEAGMDYDGELYVSDEMIINNASGIAGPDEMPGGMSGQPGEMNGQIPGNMGGQMPENANGQTSGDNANQSMPGQNAPQGMDQNGQQPPIQPNQNGTMPDMSNGPQGQSQNGQQPPMQPNQNGAMPDMSNGPQGQSQNGQRPPMQLNQDGTTQNP